MNSRQLLICVCSIVISVSLFKPAAGQSSIALSYGMGAITGDQSAGINGFSFTFRNEISKKVSFGLRVDRFSNEEVLQYNQVYGSYTEYYKYEILNVVSMIHANLHWHVLNTSSFRLSGGIGVGGTFSAFTLGIASWWDNQTEPAPVKGEPQTKGFFSLSPGMDIEVLPFKKKTFGFCGSAYYSLGLINDLPNYKYDHINSPFPTNFYAATAGLMVKF